MQRQKFAHSRRFFLLSAGATATITPLPFLGFPAFADDGTDNGALDAVMFVASFTPYGAIVNTAIGIYKGIQAAKQKEQAQADIQSDLDRIRLQLTDIDNKVTEALSILKNLPKYLDAANDKQTIGEYITSLQSNMVMGLGTDVQLVRKSSGQIKTQATNSLLTDIKDVSKAWYSLAFNPTGAPRPFLYPYAAAALDYVYLGLVTLKAPTSALNVFRDPFNTYLQSSAVLFDGYAQYQDQVFAKNKAIWTAFPMPDSYIGHTPDNTTYFIRASGTYQTGVKSLNAMSEPTVGINPRKLQRDPYYSTKLDMVHVLYDSKNPSDPRYASIVTAQKLQNAHDDGMHAQKLGAVYRQHAQNCRDLSDQIKQLT